MALLCLTPCCPFLTASPGHFSSSILVDLVLLIIQQNTEGKV